MERRATVQPSLNTIRYRKYAAADTDLPRLTTWQVFFTLTFGLVALVILIDAAGMMLEAFRVVNSANALITLMAVSVAVALMVSLWHWQQRRKTIAAADARVVGQVFAPRARISIIGSVESLEDRLHLDGAMFEPETFNASLIFGDISDPQKSMRYLLNLPSVLFITPMVQFFSLSNTMIPVAWYVPFAVTMIIVLALPILGAIRRFIRRSYIRVSPGRLEIIDYKLLRSGVIEYVHVDLRTTRIAINLIDGWIVISRPRDEAVHIPLLAFRKERGRLVDCILEAAMAEHLPPPLAVERLSGSV